MGYFIHAAKFFLPSEVKNDGFLEIKDNGTFGNYFKNLPNDNSKVIDKGDSYIAPGLVDTHIHGMLGHDVMDSNWDGINEISEGLLKTGVTSWLPTTLTGSFDQINSVCKTISANLGKETGAKIKGLHFEGPYFTNEHKGAQNPEYFKNPSIDEFKKWQSSAKGLIKKITIAPEREGAVEFTESTIKDGTVVALGHSSATFEQASACIDAGAKAFTHTFNGMSQLNHRAPGMVGAAMALDNVDDELICDGHHVRPEVAKILINLKSPEHIILVTDCMSAGLMPDGDYNLGEFPVYVKDGMARLKNGDNLAGSILKLNDSVKNVYDWGITNLNDAILMASNVPAKACNIQNECGSILPNRDADYIVLNSDLELLETYINGEKRFQA